LEVHEQSWAAAVTTVMNAGSAVLAVAGQLGTALSFASLPLL